MHEIMKYIESVAEEGTYVSLIADYPADQLYESLDLKVLSLIQRYVYQILNIKVKRHEMHLLLHPMTFLVI